jgi:hypothetical protein
MDKSKMALLPPVFALGQKPWIEEELKKISLI